MEIVVIVGKVEGATAIIDKMGHYPEYSDCAGLIGGLLGGIVGGTLEIMLTSHDAPINPAPGLAGGLLGCFIGGIAEIFLSGLGSSRGNYSNGPTRGSGYINGAYGYEDEEGNELKRDNR